MKPHRPPPLLSPSEVLSTPAYPTPPKPVVHGLTLLVGEEANLNLGQKEGDFVATRFSYKVGQVFQMCSRAKLEKGRSGALKADNYTCL